MYFMYSPFYFEGRTDHNRLSLLVHRLDRQRFVKKVAGFGADRNATFFEKHLSGLRMNGSVKSDYC